MMEEKYFAQSCSDSRYTLYRMESQDSVIAFTLLVFICFVLQSQAEMAMVMEEQKHCHLATKGQAKMGYVVRGVQDVKNLSLQNIRHIKSMLLENGVVVIEKQNLTRQQQVAFTSKLGEIVVLPASFEGNDPELGFPEIQRVTNYWSNGTWKAKKHCFGCYWHKDGNFQQNGYLASVLYADKVAENRSATLFLDNCEVYEKLTKKTLEELSRSVFTVSVRDIPDFAKGTEEDLSLYPSVKKHKGIYRHPENGRPCAYITNTLVTDKGVAHHLADAWEEVTGRSEKYTHYWKEGDLVIWDNLAVMHRAGTKRFSGPGDKTPRMLYRTQVFL